LPPAYEELDFQRTPRGDLVLRRRPAPGDPGQSVYEIKLNDEFLMSSLVHGSEALLAQAGLEGLPASGLDVVVGGLGLGHTVAAALDHPGVRDVLVVELLAPVIDWHRRGLVPLGDRLRGDSRCRFVEGDFFAMAGPGGDGFDPEEPARTFDALLVDIDHSPRSLLHPSHAALYRPEGLSRLAERLRPSGAFALWSCDLPDAEFMENLRGVFASTEAREYQFENPSTGEDETNTIYVARRRGQ
jgi:spermidine synthase